MKVVEKKMIANLENNVSISSNGTPVFLTGLTRGNYIVTMIRKGTNPIDYRRP
ncbi:hypothetical protein QEJ31_08845 [Pigmentibacter sp. JX0631]|uniref:hypothetical protein n=1 Tax=Pigmentibacter sp. JX0631 TaxID=2976982 RepID=UPI0024695ED8|nr:hypothetical protein [Pigmentibacter sp. JX0631]WGL58641.1 hypothetical protein QEJ31_08845 [Pigmentibacter sp. JX0631]